MKWKEDDVALCKVTKIEGTTVFLELEDGVQGSMVLSEVSAGRIRNLRQYVSLNKMVVCKVLRVEGGHVELSLRRVTAKEREKVLENHKKESALSKMIKLAGESPEKALKEIKEVYDEVVDFIDDARSDIKILEKFFNKEKAKKLFETIAEKEGKGKKVEKKLVLRSLSESGVRDIQEVLDCDDCEIHYLGSSKFSVSVSGENFKEANSKMDVILEEINKKAKQKKVLVEVGKSK